MQTTSRRFLLVPAAVVMLSMVSCGAAAGDELALPWIHDIAKAKEKAATEKKDLFINFTGSDWCRWCKVLDAEVFTKPEFIEKVRDRYVFLFVDFPRIDEAKKNAVVDEKANQDLAQKYLVEGFPSIVLTTSDGTVYAKTGYQIGGPTAYLKLLDELGTAGALLTNKDDTKTVALMQAAFPALVKHQLFGWPEYSRFIPIAREKDPDGKLGLLDYVLIQEENAKLEEVLGNGMTEPDWAAVYKTLEQSPHASGLPFVNAAFGSAQWLLEDQKRPAEAKVLFERVSKDPFLVDNVAAQEELKKQIAACDAAAKDPQPEGGDAGKKDEEGKASEEKK